MQTEYLTTEQLAERIHYEPRTILTSLKDRVLLEGRHYIKPFGGKKILYIWQNIEADMHQFSAERAPVIPMARGRRACQN
ncbi:MAG TPA: hypothetical protein VKO38_03335 [Wenzhouxiangella sp.]|nr:hypothetical protein [Wenzhouxiangella sp.]